MSAAAIGDAIPLRELQRAFWAWMRTGGRPGPSDRIREEAPRFVVGHAALDGAARIGIYRRMFWARQLAALRDTFAPLEAELGDLAFVELACTYLDHHPSTDPRLEYRGAALPEFLDAATAPELRALAPKARLIWASTAAALAPDAPCLTDLATLEATTFPQATLRFVPSLHLASAGEATVAFWRHGRHMREHEIPPQELTGLERARAGAPLAHVCAVLSQGASDDEQAVTGVFASLRRWFALGWIAAVETAACR